MSEKFSMFSDRVRRLLTNKWTWRIIFGLFLLEAVWFALSAQYPMAFDEQYHFGLIKLHAMQWTPWFTHQPDNAGQFGAIVRDPSYLYHWLMSFPYRLISIFTDNDAAKIIFLRLIDVALFAYGLTLYRRLVRMIGASTALSNALFAVFILVPVVPFLAAHINYDNLLFVAVPASILLTIRLLDDFKQKQVNASLLLVLIIALLTSSLIKYPFLPVLAAIVLFVIWRLRQTGLLNSKGLHAFVASFTKLTWLKRVLLLVGVIIAVGLFTERYAVNTAQYHTPVPKCDVVISHDECLQYGPFGRDDGYKATKPSNFHPNLIVYIWDWCYGMWYRLFFAINYNYSNDPPLLLIAIVSVIGGVAGLIGIGIRFKAVFKGNPLRQLILCTVVFYVLALFLDTFKEYTETGRVVAVNGRYLIPFLPFLFAFGSIAWLQILGKKYRPVAGIFATLAIAIFVLQGGGTMTYIVRAQDNWYWHNNTLRTVNRTIKDVVSPVIVGKNIPWN